MLVASCPPITSHDGRGRPETFWKPHSWSSFDAIATGGSRTMLFKPTSCHHAMARNGMDSQACADTFLFSSCNAIGRHGSRIILKSTPSHHAMTWQGKGPEQLSQKKKNYPSHHTWHGKAWAPKHFIKTQALPSCDCTENRGARNI